MVKIQKGNLTNNCKFKWFKLTHIDLIIQIVQTNAR